jgi:hypothetical protein
VEPSIADATVTSPDPAPAALTAGLRLQDDLVEQSDAGGLDVFTTTAPHPIVALAANPTVAAAPGRADGFAAPAVVAGDLVIHAAPASALVTSGGTSSERTVLGPTTAAFHGSWSALTVSIATAPIVPIEVLIELAIWLVLAAALLGRLGALRAFLGRRLRRTARGGAGAEGGVVDVMDVVDTEVTP